MENLSHALYMAFAYMVFIIAFTYSLYMVSILNTTANELLFRLDERNYYDSTALDEYLGQDDSSYRIVTTDTIIPILYRYYKESFCVKILDTDGSLLQLFDTTIEYDVRSAVTKGATTDYQKAILSLYNDSGNDCYMYDAPWRSNYRIL